MKRLPNDRKPDELDELIADAAARSKNKRRLAMQTEHGKKAEARRGYIPLSAIFEDKGFRRNFDIEKRSADGNKELVRAIEAELASNAAAYREHNEKRAEAGREGGKARAIAYQPDVFGRHAAVIQSGKELIAKGKKPRELSAIIARNHDYDKKTVREILRNADVIPKKGEV